MYVHLEDYKIHYNYLNEDVDQHKPLLVFLHEALGSIPQWRDFPNLVCNSLGVSGLVYERRGHGKSSALNSKRTPNYLYKYALQELPKLLEALQEERELILIGHSDGGSIALLYASKFHVKSIVTLAAHVINEPETIQGVLPVKRLFEKTILKEKLAKYHKENTIDIFYAWYNIWTSETFKNWNICSDINSINSPLFAIQGKDDQYGTSLQLELIQREVKQVEIWEVLNCKHTPHLEHKDEVVNRIVKFIKSL